MSITKTSIRVALVYLNASKRELLKKQPKSAHPKVRMAALIEAKHLANVIKFLSLLLFAGCGNTMMPTFNVTAPTASVNPQTPTTASSNVVATPEPTPTPTDSSHTCTFVIQAAGQLGYVKMHTVETGGSEKIVAQFPGKPGDSLDFTLLPDNGDTLTLTATYTPTTKVLGLWTEGIAHALSTKDSYIYTWTYIDGILLDTSSYFLFSQDDKRSRDAGFGTECSYQEIK